jgi:predicted transcriptional regulator
MVDIRSPRQPVTVRLPADLLKELQELAQEKQRSLDDLVTEACLAYVEPYSWERQYKQWLTAHPGESRKEFGIDGDELGAPGGQA